MAPCSKYQGTRPNSGEVGGGRETKGGLGEREPNFSGRCCYHWLTQGVRGLYKKNFDTTEKGRLPHVKCSAGWGDKVTFVNKYTKKPIIILLIYLPYSIIRVKFYFLDLVLTQL